MVYIAFLHRDSVGGSRHFHTGPLFFPGKPVVQQAAGGIGFPLQFIRAVCRVFASGDICRSRAGVRGPRRAVPVRPVAMAFLAPPRHDAEIIEGVLGEPLHDEAGLVASHRPGIHPSRRHTLPVLDPVLLHRRLEPRVRLPAEPDLVVSNSLGGKIGRCGAVVDPESHIVYGRSTVCTAPVVTPGKHHIFRPGAFHGKGQRHFRPVIIP